MNIFVRACSFAPHASFGETNQGSREITKRMFMKILLPLILCLLYSSFGIAEDNCYLTNGRYKIIYTGFSSWFGTWTMTISENTYIKRWKRQKLKKGYRINNKLEKGYLTTERNCEYIFRETGRKTDTGNFERMILTMGEPRLHIVRVNLDTLFFRTEVGQNGIVAEGIIIRMGNRKHLTTRQS